MLSQVVWQKIVMMMAKMGTMMVTTVTENATEATILGGVEAAMLIAEVASRAYRVNVSMLIFLQ